MRLFIIVITYVLLNYFKVPDPSAGNQIALIIATILATWQDISVIRALNRSKGGKI